MAELPISRPDWRPDHNWSYLHNFSTKEMSVVWSRNVAEAVTEVVVNPEVEQMISSKGAYLTKPDTLLDYAVMTSTPEQSTALHIGPATWTRSVPVAKELMYFNNFIGRYVTIKGCSLTGEDYGSTPDSVDPWGFFGVKDAENEIAVANDLLSYEFRSSLPIGYLALDASKLEKQIQECWPDSARAGYMKKQLHKVEANEDQPAILVRLTGSIARLDNVVRDGIRGEILAALCSTGCMPYTLFEDLTYKNTPSNADIDVFIDRFLQLIDNNCNALYSLFYNDEESKYSNIISVLLNLKDIDASFMHQDYEELSTTSSIRNIESYRQEMTIHFKHLIAKLLAYKPEARIRNF